MVKILCIEAAIGGASVGLVSDERLLAFRHCADPHENASRLVPMTQEVVTEAGIDWSDIGRVGVTTGPGSFTGIRLGLAAARAVGISLHVPVLGISNFDLFAHSVDPAALAGKELFVLIDSKRGDFFVQVFKNRMQATDNPEIKSLCEIKSVRPLLITGDRKPDGLDADFLDPAPPDVMIVALARLAEAAQETGGYPSPLYLRPPEAKLPEDVRHLEG